MTMRLRLRCPQGGVRTIEEFAHGELAEIPDNLTDANARDLDKAFMHTNANGVVTERWFHTAGCRRWFTVSRDTRTNDVHE